MERLRCPWCGAFLTNAPSRIIECLPGQAYECPDEGPPIICEIPPLPTMNVWVCSRCRRDLTEED